jgi:ZIP family zinc transporter
VGEAILFGLIASSALIIGGVVGSYVTPPKQVTGVLLAFASGALFSALAFELFSDAFEFGGAWRAGLGLLAGGATFVIVNAWLDSRVAGRPREGAEREGRGRGGARRLRLGGPVGSGGLRAARRGHARRRAGEPRARRLARGRRELLHAARRDLLLEPAGVAGRRGRDARERPVAAVRDHDLGGLRGGPGARGGPRPAVLSGASHSTLAFCLAFAGGAVLASLADTLMPEAFEHGRPWNSFATGLGFFVSFMLAEG